MREASDLNRAIPRLPNPSFYQNLFSLCFLILFVELGFPSLQAGIPSLSISSNTARSTSTHIHYSRGLRCPIWVLLSLLLSSSIRLCFSAASLATIATFQLAHSHIVDDCRPCPTGHIPASMINIVILRFVIFPLHRRLQSLRKLVISSLSWRYRLLT